MVSNGQITGMILAILIPMIIVCALFVYMKRQVRMKGFIIVFFFGVAGFIWQAFIKSYIIAFAVTPMSQSSSANVGRAAMTSKILPMKASLWAMASRYS